jgi:hypothetical protein
MKRSGVSDYQAVYEDKFTRPYQNTEFLDDASGKLNLRGCRSVSVDRNFRLIFVICEECRKIPQCEYCFCEDLPDKTVVFLTVGPHDRAYAIK